MNIRQRGDGYWELYVGKIAGKRIRKTFKTESLAKAAMKDEEKKKARLGRAAHAISDAEVMEFIRVKTELKKFDATLEDAVEFFVKYARPMGEPLKLDVLVDQVLTAKLSEGKRPRYLSQLKCSAMSLCNAGHGQRWAHEISTDDIEGWLRGQGWAPKTQNVYLTDVRTVFSWAKEKGIVTRNPAEEVKKLTLDSSEVEILSYMDCLRLLVRVTRCPSQAGKWKGEDFSPLLGYTVIGLFCGIRPEEMARLDWAEVNLDEGTVLIPGHKSKTRQRRVVDLSENALEWMALIPKEEMTGSLVPVNFRRRWDRFRRAAGFKVKAKDSRGRPWPHDAMRHTYASMHYAAHQNEYLLQAQMGHTDGQMLFRHYRAVASRRTAEAFWKIRPAKKRSL